jgi:hypothetical protein
MPLCHAHGHRPHYSALIIVLMNLIIDISYGFLDPRVRYKKGCHGPRWHLPSEGTGKAGWMHDAPKCDRMVHAAAPLTGRPARRGRCAGDAHGV